MSIITITSGIHTNSEAILKKLSATIDSIVITDNEVIEATSLKYGIKKATLQKVLESKLITFNNFSHKKEKSMAAMKMVLSGFIKNNNIIFYGITGQLISDWVTHVLKVRITSDIQNRIKNGMSNPSLSEKDIAGQIKEADLLMATWIHAVKGKKLRDKALFDIVVQSDKLETDKAVNMIIENLESLLKSTQDLNEEEVKNFALASEVEYALAAMSGELTVEADRGKITVTINENVLMLAKLKQKIVSITQGITGITSVETKIGKDFYKSNIIRSLDFETSPNLLLVDDEKEFVETLSERLKMRDFKSKIAYSGKEALDFTNREDTEVMVLDLKMPGIDGFEVLKKIKQEKPAIEVIILTGHGSEKDKETCLNMGAFAYLQKPADIDLLTDTMKKAYAKSNKETS